VRLVYSRILGRLDLTTFRKVENHSFDFGFSVLKVDQDTYLDSSGSEVVKQLCFMDLVKSFDRFKFKDDFFLH
jgi:hypothetical protein